MGAPDVRGERLSDYLKLSWHPEYATTAERAGLANGACEAWRVPFMGVESSIGILSTESGLGLSSSAQR